MYDTHYDSGIYYVMLHVDAGGNPARHCHLGPGRHLYAVFVLICLACFMKCIFLCCMLFSCLNIDVSVFIFGKKLCRAYVIMLYTCRIKIKFSYLIRHLYIYLWSSRLSLNSNIQLLINVISQAKVISPRYP
jgi:hypothetical protein